MAVLCPKCGYDNAHGALFCAECFAILGETVQVPGTVALDKREMVGITKRAFGSQRAAHEGKLGSHAIALYINNSPEPMIALLTTQAIIGRAVPGDAQPRIDLNPYGALDKGVSRQHAIFKRTDKGLMFEDMGSSNGSWLNGAPLKPYTPAVLHSGDRLRLSQIEIEVYMTE